MITAKTHLSTHSQLSDEKTNKGAVSAHFVELAPENRKKKKRLTWHEKLLKNQGLDSHTVFFQIIVS